MLQRSLCPQIKLEDAEQKKTVAEGIAETVSKEKAIVEVETAKAQVQAEQVAKTQAEVSVLAPAHQSFWTTQCRYRLTAGDFYTLPACGLTANAPHIDP